MRNTITRTITVSTIHTATVELKDGIAVLSNFPKLTAYGTITKEKALKMAQKRWGKQPNMIVVGIDEKETLYEITVEDFIAHAKVVENPTETDTDTE